jgi:DNA-binding response OmpR family regulator
MDHMTGQQGVRTNEEDVYALRAHLLFNSHECVLVRWAKHVPLTARECLLLRALLRAPRHYLSTSALSGQVSHPTGAPIEGHSIEQTICNLRKKMGERAHRPRLLLTKRGLGYGIFPQSSVSLPSEESR